MSEAPPPYDTLDPSVKELATLIGHLPVLAPPYMGNDTGSIDKAKAMLKTLKHPTPENILQVLLDNDPTKDEMAALALERFQRPFETNTEIFATVSRPHGARKDPVMYHSRVQHTQSPVVDHTAGLEVNCRRLSKHGSHDIHTRGAQRSWSKHRWVYKQDDRAAWFSNLLKNRISNTSLSSARGYCWTITIDYDDDYTRPASTRNTNSVGYQIHRYFFYLHDLIEAKLEQAGVHSAEHPVARAFNRAQAEQGVVVLAPGGRRISSFNRAAIRILSGFSDAGFPESQAEILRRLRSGLENVEIEVEIAPTGEVVHYLSRPIVCHTLPEWKPDLEFRPYPSIKQQKSELLKLAMGGVGVEVDTRCAVGFRCAVIPFANYIGVGVDWRKGSVVKASAFGENNRSFNEIIARAGCHPCVVIRYGVPIALIRRC